MQSFEEFWPYYVREHAKPLTRAFHFVGTTSALTCTLGFAVTGNPIFIPAALVSGYGPAWFSHFFIEKNRPATFTYPLWSLRADLVMYGKMWRGLMQAEVDRVCGDPSRSFA